MLKTLNFISALMIIISLLYTIVVYQNLPSEVPTHYNLYGKPDAWGNKPIIFLIPGISAYAWLLIYIVYKYYDKIAKLGLNFKNEIPSEEAIRFDKKLLVVLNFESALSFSLSHMKDVYNILGGNIDFGVYELVIFLSIILITLVYGILKGRKYK